jgi:hypothetical protein
MIPALLSILLVSISRWPWKPGAAMDYPVSIFLRDVRRMEPEMEKEKADWDRFERAKKKTRSNRKRRIS